MSANPCALLPARAPVLGSRAGGRRVCVSGCPGDPRLPGSPWRAPAFRPGPGDPLPQHRDPRAPPAHFAKARKRPSRRQRNSNLLHSRPLRPPQTLPGALPRPRRRRARTGRGREAGWASLLPYAGRLETASDPGPGTSRGSRAPALRCADSPGPPAPPPGIQIVPHLSRRATGGRGAHTKRVQGWIQSAGVEEIPPGLGTGPGAAIYLPDFFFDLGDVCEDEEDHEQRERSQHPAPELQLHGGFAPTGTRAGRREELELGGAAAGARASARSRADTLRSGRVRASSGGGGSRQGLLRRREPARSLSARVRPSSPLPSPPFPRPARGPRAV